MATNQMQMPGAPGYRFFHVAGAHKPVGMGRVLAAGDEVEWDSACGGSWSRKEGRVIEVVPAGCRPRNLSATETRDHESYVVRSGGATLWPAVASIRRR